MKRVLLKISYDGTNYCGWQVQPNGKAVQETLQDALEEMLKERVNLTGCSRTDAGVHAREFYCHFDCNESIPTAAFVPGLNRLLPDDIAVLSAIDVAPDFHARYSAKGKKYVYVIDNGIVADPLLSRYALHIKNPLSIEKMNTLCSALVGTHDFKSFSSSKRTVTDTVRTISECGVEKKDNLVLLSVTGNGFLYNMVRIIVGTALDASNGKLNEKDIERIFELPREEIGMTVPAKGLFLEKVLY
ncbi:MAG: tRNA pseudouridine(38-40) synthase TruA [Ruminococcaceae bacterium]|nr:tRNA pseudouridine(38-40) synthase TruA [Oscillospiraceae bacterium]